MAFNNFHVGVRWLGGSAG